MIRRWCQDYADGLDFESDYQRWVVEEFSGILCVDEVYQDKLALLVAVDPSAPNGDRLVGYELIHGRVERKDVEGFLERLRRVGVEPEEIITDGSPLYPGALKEVWPSAVHQLCLFHESRLVTGEIYKAFMALRKSVPEPPPVSQPTSLKGLPRKCPNPEKLAAHRTAIARVFALYKQGVSIRGIRRQTGHSRNTIKRWLRGEIPKAIAEAELPSEWILDEILLGEDTPEQKESTTTSQPVSTPEVPPPYNSWEQVRKIRNLLWQCRYIVLRRPDHLKQKDREKLDFLLESPIGEQVRLVRGFLEEWYLLFHDEQRIRRCPAEAKERYDRLKNNPEYRTLKPLARLQARFDEEHFQKVSSFLKYPQWEATNNGAERCARGFRHLQAPHYGFRKPRSIEGAVKVKAWLSKEENDPTTRPPSGRCTRGRKARRTSAEMPMAA